MSDQTPNDPHTLALQALAATLSDERRARRFLELTGIGTDELRASADNPQLLGALIGFLEAHEPDLLAVADQLNVAPAAIVRAGQILDPSKEFE